MANWRQVFSPTTQGRSYHSPPAIFLFLTMFMDVFKEGRETLKGGSTL